MQPELLKSTSDRVIHEAARSERYQWQAGMCYARQAQARQLRFRKAGSKRTPAEFVTADLRVSCCMHAANPAAAVRRCTCANVQP